MVFWYQEVSESEGLKAKFRPSAGPANRRNPFWVRANHIEGKFLSSRVRLMSDLCALAVLGVCLGMQLAVCEFARNMLGWAGMIYLYLPFFF